MKNVMKTILTFVALFVIVTFIWSCSDKRAKAIEQYNLGNYQDALSLYKDIEKTSRLDYIDFYRLASIYRSLGNNDESILYYNKSLELNRENPNSLIALGSVYEDIGQYERAIKFYLLALDTKGNPVDFVVFYRLGRCYAEINNIEKSVVYFGAFVQKYVDYEKEGKNLIDYEKLLDYSLKFLEKNAAVAK
ncbi:tetratricopeptide repeat protein [Leptospira stimsonii]|uniref:Tetratricopeptide repeat protein n=2 Tax=Leptospira stimsonii TaxID=2202203 RepID=A0ABY2MXG1_9LEPT|nr:tetratricopeptide repeat protein [Leptospira stimsonii]TGM10728.1 tetratricopeptide repeat protein [Leptospira stimsonii]